MVVFTPEGCTKPDCWRALTSAGPCLSKSFLQAWPAPEVQRVRNDCNYKSSLIPCWKTTVSIMTIIFQVLPISTSFSFCLPCLTISHLQWPKAGNSIRPLITFSVPSVSTVGLGLKGLFQPKQHYDSMVAFPSQCPRVTLPEQATAQILHMSFAGFNCGTVFGRNVYFFSEIFNNLRFCWSQRSSWKSPLEKYMYVHWKRRGAKKFCR